MSSVKTRVINVGIALLSERTVFILLWLMLIALTASYFLIDKERFIYYLVTFVVNQIFTFLVFGTGILMLINMYLFRKFPSIIDDFLLFRDKNLYLQEAYVYQVFIQWQVELTTKPIGFNSLGKELLITNFIQTEIYYIENALRTFIQNFYRDMDADTYSTCTKICDKFTDIMITERVKFDIFKKDTFVNRITINPEVKLPPGRKKAILSMLPDIFILKYIYSCSDFNIFLNNCVSEARRKNLSRHATIDLLYSNLVICLFSYKDNILPNFLKEFNGDLAHYHLLFDGVPLSENSNASH